MGRKKKTKKQPQQCFLMSDLANIKNDIKIIQNNDSVDIEVKKGSLAACLLGLEDLNIEAIDLESIEIKKITKNFLY